MRCRNAASCGLLRLGLALQGLVLTADAAEVSRPNVLILMADNWAAPHASRLGDPVVKTPTFDALAERGVLFRNAFCAVPSCAPARAVFVTGLYAHRLGPGANLNGTLPAEFTVFPDLLEQSGYRVGYSGKGWSPGSVEASRRSRNPAGDKFPSFEQFLQDQPRSGTPFCFWFSSRNPHVPWTDGQANRATIDEQAISIPEYLPDEPETRRDIAGYYAEVEDFDSQCREHLELLAAAGQSEQTLVIMTGDNGWQMPRGLAHIYDSGTHVPLVIAGPGVTGPGRIVDSFVGFEDFAPTFAELAGVPSPPRFDGVSLCRLLRDPLAVGRDHIFLERERHANVRRGDLCYPVRAIRTADDMYIRNLRPERGPSGDAEFYYAVGEYGDVDASLTKELLIAPNRPARLEPYFERIFGLRPAEELYDLRTDPDQIHNLAADPAQAETLQRLRAQVETWMSATGDPRCDPRNDSFDGYPYLGPSRRQQPAAR
ncbi:MAG: sulfatase [Planctomycetaceae bacterium]